jgi:hypothetical protein
LSLPAAHAMQLYYVVGGLSRWPKVFAKKRR